MALDGIYLHFLINEMNAFCIGAKIDKIYQPSRYELVFALRTRTARKNLFISVGGNSPRLNLTEESFDNPANPPMLCMLLRKQLTGAIITEIRQAGCDRIVFIDLDATDDIGDRVKRTVAVEIMAQYSNCILIDENGNIVDSLKRVDATKSSVREVLPKLSYQLPPGQDKLDITLCKCDEIISRVKAYSGKSLSSALLSSVAGFSPLVSRELAYRSCGEDKAVSDLTVSEFLRLEEELAQLKKSIEVNIPSPVILKDNTGNMTEFCFMPVTLYRGFSENIPIDSLSLTLDRFYLEKERLQRTKSRADDLFRLLAACTDRTSKKITVQTRELAECDSMETKRIYAELINANLYSLKKGDTVYHVQNYYDEYKNVEIPVSPLLTPSANSQKYYKEYRKLQTARKILAEQLEKGRADLEYLMTVRDELERASSEKEISEIRAELSVGGFLKSKTGTKNKKNAPLPPLEFVSPSGYTVLVGRNNIQNDLISFKKARKTDLWFHVQKAPGSHVILCCEGNEPAEKDIEFAACTAAYFSSVRARGMAEVDWTKAGNLKKHPAARPGFVIYHVYNTIYAKSINPEEK